MTREQAIEHGIEQLEIFGGEHREFIELAIKALEQEPTTQERQAESDKFDGAYQDGYDYGYAQARFDYEQKPTTENDIRDNRVKNELNRVKNELEPTTKNCESCRYYGSHHDVCNYCYKCSLWTEQEPTQSPITIIDWNNCHTSEQLKSIATTKNDLPHCQHTDEEIAKSFIEDVETVKEQLSCGEQMDFPNTFDEFAKDYGFKDKDEVYTNGAELIPIFRVKQWLEHISNTKNDLGVDAITMEQINKYVIEINKILEEEKDDARWCAGLRYSLRVLDKYCGDVLNHLPSVTPQEPCDKCEVGNPCLYCKHEFEPQESEDI